MLRKMKRIIFLLMLVLVGTSLAGCSNLDYTIFELSDGSIKEIYTAAFGEDEFKASCNNLGFTTTETNNALITLKNNLNTRLQTIAFNLKNNFNDLIDSSQISPKREELKAGFNAEAIDENGQHRLELSFKNNEVYRYFYGITQQDLDDAQNSIIEEQSFFFTTYKQPSKTRFGIEYESTTLGLYIWQETEEEIEDVLGTEHSITPPPFTYTYATSSNRLHSDSDELYKSYGYNFHVWNLTTENTTRDIMFYNVEARREIWYPLILGVSVIFLVALEVVNLINKKIKKKKNDEEEIIVEDAVNK